MGFLTSEHPNCMTKIKENETILSNQLKLLANHEIKEVVIPTVYFDDILIEYCDSLNLLLYNKLVKNPIFNKTNYIYCAREESKD